MTQGTILLVEDNEDDATLTVLAFKRANLLNKVVVADAARIARGGAEDARDRERAGEHQVDADAVHDRDRQAHPRTRRLT